MTAPRVVVAGGHSAGHIEPTMNFADALRRLEPTAEITALGTVRGLDTTLIPARGYPLELIPPVPLPRRLNRALLQAPGRLRDWVRAAGAMLDHVRPEVVVGFGGYTWPCRPTSPPAGRACRSSSTRRAPGPEWPAGWRPG
jgi:UDP-N-acetylglucosamine--N-acetylmuramyl-(pentapeptide) pyrophosphoryl-undecaprenol N-acetylglucosamine transferase